MYIKGTAYAEVARKGQVANSSCAGEVAGRFWRRRGYWGPASPWGRKCVRGSSPILDARSPTVRALPPPREGIEKLLAFEEKRKGNSSTPSLW